MNDPYKIELRLENVSQLFNTLDPFPFKHDNLSTDVDEYIVRRAQDIPYKRPVEIVVHLASEFDSGTERRIAQAVSGWFATRAKAETGEVRLLFRDGRVSFLVGLCILAVILPLLWYATFRFEEGPFIRVLRGSVVIIGWVVIWRPMETIVYEWVPIVRRRALYRKLSQATVRVRKA